MSDEPKQVLVVRCKDNSHAGKYLTLHRLYDVIKDDVSIKMYLIMADHGHQLLYNRSRFEVVVTKHTVNPAEVWTL